MVFRPCDISTFLTGELVPAPPGYVPVQQQQRQAVAPSVVNSPPLLQNEVSTEKIHTHSF